MSETCRDCGVSYEDFGQKAKRCRPCKQAYERKLYARKTKAVIDKKVRTVAARRAKLQRWVLQFLKENPCEVCGEKRWACLQFDHLKGEDKLDTIGHMLRHGHALDALKEEIAKCRVLCANCHCLKTSIDHNWYKKPRKADVPREIWSR